MIKKIMLLVPMFLASPAHGMVYSWTDSAGVSHYTNKVYEIPERYRAKAKARYPDQSDIPDPNQNVQTAQAKAAPYPGKPEAPAAPAPSQGTQTPQAKPVPVKPNKGSSAPVVTHEAEKKKPEHAGRWKHEKARAPRSTYPDE